MIGALIVTFNPDIAVLKSNVDAVAKQVDILVIVDNGSQNFNEINNLTTKSIIIPLDENKGIAYALNTGMVYLEEKSVDWVLTLDQDSIVPPDLIKMFTIQAEFQKEKTAILAAKFVDEDQIDFKDESKNTVSDPLVITAGSLTRLTAWRHAGGFDNWLFIDAVDHDFNYRLLGLGYDVFKINSLEFKHSLGTAVNRPILKRLLLIKKDGQPADHSEFRQYYIYRNGVVLAKRYAENPRYRIFKLVATLRVILLFKNPVAKLRAAIHGLVDGLKYSEKEDEFFQAYQRKL